MPTQAAWAIGTVRPNLLVERYLQDHGDYPRAVGLSVWGTATMRTGGDDIAQALALMGVRPKWAAGQPPRDGLRDPADHDFNRPRIDVTLRVSGFFRDAFANLMHLFDAAVQAVAELDELDRKTEPDPRPHPARARCAHRARPRCEGGAARAGWRVFSTKPGAYGAGLQELIDAKAMAGRRRPSRAYQSRGGYAYVARRRRRRRARDFGARLASIDAVRAEPGQPRARPARFERLSRVPGRHGRGGAASARRSNRSAYNADHSNPAAPRIRTLNEEISRGDPFARGEPEMDRRR